MRGKFLSILASVLCVGEIAMAAVPLNSIALGGIVPGMTKGDVERIYGSCKVLHPYQYSSKRKTYFGVIGYGNSVVISMGGSSAFDSSKVEMVVVSADNGFTTPEGIHVGSTKQEVINAYGQPDFGGNHGNYGNIVVPTIRKKNIQNIMYNAVDSYEQMGFELEDGIVTEIRIGVPL